MERIRRFTALLLTCAIMLSTNAFALSSSPDKATTLYWVSDEASLSNLIHSDGTAVQSISETTDVTHYLSTNEIAGTDSMYATYTFNIGTGSITVTGVLDYEELEPNFSVYTGTLRGSTIINDLRYKVNVVLTKKSDTTDVNAGITLAPVNAQSLDDYIFLGIGDEIITTEMLQSRTENNSGDSSAVQTVSISDEAIAPCANSDFVFKTSSTAGFSASNPNTVTGTAQQGKVYYDPVASRFAVGVTTNVEAVEAVFSQMGVAGASVYNLTIGLQKNDSGNPYIAGMESIPMSTSPTSVINSNFISLVCSIVSTVWGISGPALTAYESMLNEIEQESSAYVNRSYDTNNSYAQFKFSSLDTVSFDDAPLVVVFQTDTANPGTASFSGYSYLEYRVMLQAIGSSAPIAISIDANDLTTLGVSITL